VRLVFAAIVDAAAVAVAGFAGFWLGYHLTPCSDVSDCPPLAPVTVIAVIVFVGTYFLVGYYFLHRTVGQWLLGVKDR
jgi:hypothetical protein